MNRLKRYYNDRVHAVGSDEFLAQVGHTERGSPITQIQFDRMVERICDLLELGPEDDLLDLCCGNGVITQQLSKRARTVFGIDFSSSLIDIANQNHLANNIQYHVLNVFELDRVLDLDTPRPTKILMHGALQHFSESDFEPLIKSMLSVAAEAPTILTSFVPEKQKKALFYDTPKRKFDHIVRRLTGRDVMGTWWDRGFIEQTCQKLGLQSSFFQVDQSSEAARYRFDLKMVASLPADRPVP